MENFLGLTLFQTITWLLNGRPLDLHRRPDLSDLLRITDDDGDSSVLRFSPFPPSRFTPAVHSGAVACVAEDERLEGGSVGYDVQQRNSSPFRLFNFFKK